MSLLVGCSSQGQTDLKQMPSAAEINYKKYFKRNESKIDPIEGVWYEYAVGSLYNDRLLLKRIREPNRATWIVIKDPESNRYTVLNANGKKNYFNAFFTPSNTDNIFLFDCEINDENSKLSTKAQMKNKNKLEMEFNAPESMITDRYNSLDGDIELHWKIEWIKSSP